MLKSLHIQNFRGFRDLKIHSLKRVNLVCGGWPWDSPAFDGLKQFLRAL